MANLITLSRLILLFLVVWISYQPIGAWQLASFFLIILIFVSDGLDGYIARKRNETTLFGALFDIAGDRVAELTLWVVAADLNLVSIAVPIVFIIRGVVVDTIRSSSSVSRGLAPFALMQSAVGKFLVAGKFMRILYAVVKACAFCGLFLLRPLPRALPEFWAYVGGPVVVLTYAFVYMAVALCILRGLPVVVEFVHDRKEDIIRSTQSKP